MADFAISPYLLDDWPWMRAKASKIGVESFDQSNVLRCDNASTKAALAGSKEVLECIARLRLLAPSGKILSAGKELSLDVRDDSRVLGNSYSLRRADPDRRDALEDLGEALDRLFATHKGGADPGLRWIGYSLALAALPFLCSFSAFFSSRAGWFLQIQERPGALGLVLVLGLTCFSLAMIPFLTSSWRNIVAAFLFPLAVGGGWFSSDRVGAFLDTQYPISVIESRAKINEVVEMRSQKTRLHGPTTFYVTLVEPVDLGNGETSMRIQLTRDGFKSLDGLPLGDLVIVHGIGMTGRPVIFSWRYEKRKPRPWPGQSPIKPAGGG